jgi:hypothetical protein
MKIEEHLTPQAVLEEIGHRLARRRLSLSMTQAAAAGRRGLVSGRSNGSSTKSGKSCRIGPTTPMRRVLPQHSATRYKTLFA